MHFVHIFDSRNTSFYYCTFLLKRTERNLLKIKIEKQTKTNLDLHLMYIFAGFLYEHAFFNSAKQTPQLKYVFTVFTRLIKHLCFDE